MTRAFRRCLRDPLTSLLAVVIVALATGASTALFSILYAIAIVPLPFPDARQLVVVTDRHHSAGPVGVTPGRYRDWKTRLQPVAALGALWPGLAFNTYDDGGPFRANGALADRTLFAVLGRSPELGRFFQARDFEPDAPPVAILSGPMWKERASSDAAVLGRVIVLDGVPHQIVGVLPRDWVTPAGDVDVWLPLRLTVWNRVSRNLTLVGRLQRGVKVEQAQQALATAHAEATLAYPDTDGVVTPVVEDLAVSLGGASRTPVFFVFCASIGLVCLIGLNLAVLFLARVAARRQEIAIQRALGAKTIDLVLLQLSEGAVLVSTGAAAGFVLARLAMPALTGLVAGASPSPLLQPNLELTIPAVAAAAACAVVILMLASMTPLISSFGVAPFEVLRTRHVYTGRRARHAFVIVEVAGAVALVLTAAALSRSVATLVRTDPGFSAQQVLTARVTLPSVTHGSADLRRSIAERLTTELESLAGVERAAIGSVLPFRTAPSPFNFITDVPGSERHQAEHRSVSAGYFETLGLTTLAGRTFTVADRKDSPLVTVVTAKLAAWWNVERPVAVVGRRISIDGPQGPWREIVGVVADTRHSALTQEGRGELYLPWSQEPWPAIAVLVRFGPGASPSASQLRRALATVDPRLPLFDIQMLDERLRASLGVPFLLQRGFSVFAGLAGVLALAGVFALLAWNVASRRSEIALRIALGASPRAVGWSSMLDAARLLAFGIGFGTPAAWAITQVVAAVVPGFAALDAGTTVVALTGFGAVVALISVVPARRAAATDPGLLARG